jgi:hypothetical protein
MAKMVNQLEKKNVLTNSLNKISSLTRYISMIEAIIIWEIEATNRVITT